MRRLFYPLALIVLSLAPAHAQKAPEFGSVTLDEIKMTKYALDTAASAVIIFDRGASSISEDLTATFKRHIRIKFFTQDGIDEWANNTLRYSQGQSISRLRGITYNLENGKIVESKMNDESIFKTKVDKFRSTIKFTLPNVKPGSIIEYSYNMQGEGFLMGWRFQHVIPIMHSEYELSIPKTFSFKKDFKGYLSVTDHVQKNDGAYEKWIIRDAPAFKVEPYITTLSDYLSSIDFYLTELFIPGRPLYNFKRSWAKIAADYHEDSDFGGLLRGNGWMSRIVDPIVAKGGTPEEIMANVYYTLKANVSWDGEVEKWAQDNLKKVWEDKSGSTAEINMLLVAMLQRAGLEAYPVVLSTRDNGRVNQFSPQAESFDDVICLVKLVNKDRLLDATNKNLPYTALPRRCLNGEGLVVHDKESRFVPLVSTKSRTVTNTEFKINESGEIAGVMTILRDGLEAGDMRREFKDLGKEKYLTETFSGKSWEVSKSDFANIEEVTNSPKETHEILVKDHVQVAGDVMYVSPYLTGAMTENLFKADTRMYPVDYGTTFDEFYVAKMQIPDSYVVEELPQTKIFALPEGLGRFVYSVTQTGNAINIVSQLTISKTVIPTENYAQLREFYAIIIAKQAEQIVLKKKT